MNNPLESIMQTFNVYASKPENMDLVPGKTGITVRDLKFVLEEMGEKVTEFELQELFNRMDSKQEGLISFEQFYNVMSSKRQGQELFETVLNGFRYLDKEGKGYIDVNEFRYLMSQFGEKFPLDEIKLMIETGAHPDDPTKINYEKFVNKMFFKDTGEEEAEAKPPAKGAKKK